MIKRMTRGAKRICRQRFAKELTTPTPVNYAAQNGMLAVYSIHAWPGTGLMCLV
jgi:hypothetical protein